jgi:uncharacterized membrane protein HdeD (DUF308 family)
MAQMKHIGLLLLGIWLILTGLVSIANLHFQYIHIVTGALALVAGIFLIVRR